MPFEPLSGTRLLNLPESRLRCIVQRMRLEREATWGVHLSTFNDRHPRGGPASRTGCCYSRCCCHKGSWGGRPQTPRGLDRESGCVSSRAGSVTWHGLGGWAGRWVLWVATPQPHLPLPALHLPRQAS